MGARMKSSSEAPVLAALASACDQSAAPGSGPVRTSSTNSSACGRRRPESCRLHDLFDPARSAIEPHAQAIPP
jgi:hypothetical protein